MDDESPKFAQNSLFDEQMSYENVWNSGPSINKSLGYQIVYSVS